MQQNCTAELWLMGENVLHFPTFLLAKNTTLVHSIIRQKAPPRGCSGQRSQLIRLKFEWEHEIVKILTFCFINLFLNPILYHTFADISVFLLTLPYFLFYSSSTPSSNEIGISLFSSAFSLLFRPRGVHFDTSRRH